MTREQQPLRVTAEKLGFRHAEDKLQAELTLINHEERPVFVTVGIRQVVYEEASRTLTLWLSDHGRTHDARHRCGSVYLPQMEILEPGARRTIQLSLAHHLTRLVPHPDQTFHFESLDLSPAEHLIVHIGCSDRPFYYNPKGPTAIEQLNAWCNDLTVEGRKIKPTRARKAPQRKK
ncbi:MAG: hypothetical protein ACYDAI_18775 [Trichloromonadaceae bacterium]